MQRGGGVEEECLLAISPPPEFQDSPAPPPPVFRDASGTALRDFADRISFDILNEAMVIATEEVLSFHHGRSGRTPPDQLLPCPITSDFSDTDEENPVSTTTSWEYLSKASSWSDLRCLRSPSPHHSRLHTSPRHKDSRSSRNHKKPDSSNALRFVTSSSSSRNHNPVSFQNEKPSSTPSHQAAVMRSASFHMDALFPNLNLLPSTSTNSTSNDLSADRPGEGSSKKSRNRSAEDGSDCYNVPFQCDIYSLPIDNVSSHSEEGNQPTNAPKRSRCRASRHFSVPLGQSTSTNIPQTQRRDDHLGRNSREVPTSSFKDGGHTSNRNVSERRDVKPELSHIKLLPVLDARERNNNLDRNQEQEMPTNSRSLRPPRSRSVEMSNPGSGGACRKNNSSHNNSSFPADPPSSTLGDQHCTGKQEKRTLGHSILNLFKRNKPRTKCEAVPVTFHPHENHSNETRDCNPATNTYRALPLPPELDEDPILEDIIDHHHPPEARDFAASIEKVKDCGWYWGPLSSEAAEDLLRGEPDGSFIVRDSSDAHYIFSLTFKLNGLVRHVRIEHDQGNFSFGPLTRFKASTIVDFVEKAVAHSRSGRYLFFLHRRPVLGPMRVQLLHPYSRFRHPRSLQHMCRFVILKYVRRDLIHTLPLPKPLQDYLNTPHYYFEQHEPKKTAS